MKFQISDIINKHKGQKCIVIGHGPSLNEYNSKIKYLKEKGYFIIGCNNWNEFYPQCPPDYWINVNNVDTSKNMMHIINYYKCFWIYADSVDLTDQQWINENIQTDYLSYDQRHFEGKECEVCKTFGCNKYRYNRLTIQEELMKFTKFNKRYQSGHTVALHSISFSILMGFSEIYLTGLDFNYRLGYASNNTNRTPPGPSNYFDKEIYGGDILDDMKIIADSSNNIGTKIYNSNKQSTWKHFEYKEIL